MAFVVKFWSICVLLALGIALGFGAGLGTAIYIRVSYITRSLLLECSLHLAADVAQLVSYDANVVRSAS